MADGPPNRPAATAAAGSATTGRNCMTTNSIGAAITVPAMVSTHPVDLIQRAPAIVPPHVGQVVTLPATTARQDLFRQ